MATLDMIDDTIGIKEYTDLPKSGKLTDQVKILVTELYVSSDAFLTEQGYPEIFGSKIQQYIDEQMEFLDGGVCYLLFDGERVIGLAHLIIFDTKGFVGMLIVDEEYRGRGFGRKLLDCCKAKTKKEDCNIMGLTVISNNRDAYSLYYKYGMRDSKITMRMKV